MAAPRPPKGKKNFNDNNSPIQGNRGGRPQAWRASGGSNYANPARQNSQGSPLSGGSAPRETGYDSKLLATLATAKGSSVILALKNGARHEGIVAGIISEGDAAGVTLKDCRDLGDASATVRASFVVPASNIQSWSPKPSNGRDSFRTDVDISATGAQNGPRERELQPWQQPEGTTDVAASLAALQGDEATFGPPGAYSGVPWDQFEVNERLYGVKTNFDEDIYTTKLDPNAPGFKERERKAQQIANEILSGTTNNPHVAEERNVNGTENGVGEEEKYSAVVRAPGAYVPPGARRNGAGAAVPPATAASTGASASGGTSTPVTKVTPTPTPAPTSGPAQAPAATGQKTDGPAATAATAATGAPNEGLLGDFLEFVTSEKNRLAQRKQAMVKTDMDKRKADLLKFSKSFKLPRPIPEDLVPILAKDEEKQKAIVEKANAELQAAQQAQAQAKAAAAANAVTSTAATTKVASSPGQAAKPGAKPAATAPADSSAAPKPKGGMFIQEIPPFNRNKVRKPGTPAAPGTTPSGQPAAPAIQATPSSPTTAQATARLNANASVFKPNANAPVFKPVSPGATPPPPKGKENVAKDAPAVAQTEPPNPFYGARAPTKKGVSVHLKEDFNPFRHSKVVDASQVSSIWPYNGKRFAALHPILPGIHPAPGINMPVPQISGPPTQPHEEDPAAQQQAHGQRPIPPQQPIPAQQPQPPQGYPMMYYQYPYSPAPHGQQPMMMPPASPYMPSHYMQPVAYPHHMPPNAPMYGHPPPGMAGVPPTPHYMPHTPYGATSPPPTGTPRGPGPMPPQQMPPHTYYHPSPQLTHAMPYPMMMPSQPGPHYDPATQGPPPVAPQPAPMGH